MKQKTILVVEDRGNTLKVIAAILEDEGYHVLSATHGQAALDLYRINAEIDVVLSDLKMPEMDGIALFKAMQAIRRPPPFVIMTAYGTVKSAVGALKEGVANYLIKPLDYEELVIVLEKAVRDYSLSQELKALKASIEQNDAFHDMIGSDEKMLKIFERVRMVGPTDVSVLIYGETGTGKELLARAIHLESGRHRLPMVCINSAALSENLLEAELFGYVKGAFTGAVSDRRGRLESAHQSTLFLDEIGHMSLKLQAKLLRFLQEMSFEPVGDRNVRHVDVRVIAATNLDLQELIQQGKFLKDLLYRLEVVPMRLPPLRQRSGDICLLADHFVRQMARQYNKPVDGITPEALKCISAYAWPGNVRQLKNTMARSVILSRGASLTKADLPETVVGGAASVFGSENDAILPPLPPEGISLKTMEIDLIRRTLSRCEGNKSLAARQLGISRKTLYEKIQRYDLEG
ncbi:acetoacetate metabolism regulatory protein AtoC [Desulfosarcina ovata subsp. sediminis]|uniref:Acetoacetate metabolism regulatory protein AtoC n=1 Tax=Desulfosarcina ovata subsp. sediminis TaxID=885957 RepID=A0A5K8A191_9BACT|nr:sigma-54 dependent transcriptional regulator [Desulfosarcina ovata]BBO86196.1 acetoacetate metabolism regulatory protein AtoC [Desulfosarcina ovata subsp. sediminis]